ncbi:MAG: glycosyl hydrolase family 18 protein [Lentisphaerota bacterium]
MAGQEIESTVRDQYVSPSETPWSESRAVSAEIPPRGFISIHQSEADFYRTFPSRSEQEYDLLRLQLRTAPVGPFVSERKVLAGSLQKQVFGWHPYWEGTSYTNYDFSVLSSVAYFSYEVNPANGAYVDIHSWTTTPLVGLAQTAGVKVVLAVTCFGNADNQTLLNNASAKTNLTAELLRLVKLRNADGVNIDFEGISDSSLRSQVTSFMTNLAARFHSEIPGSQVSIDLPAVDWSSIFDVPALNASLDLLIIMGYDYHWAGGPNAGPVAPLRHSATWGTLCVERSVSNYLSAGASPGKLILGVPYYGYEWPTESLKLNAATLGSATTRAYPSAVNRAATYGRLWDANSSVPYFLTGPTGSYTQCWYDDTESLGEKYDFVTQRGIGGIGIWALGYDDEQTALWQLLADKFTAPVENWSAQNPGTATNLYGVSFGSGRFFTMGTGGTILSSSNGTTWTQQASGTHALLLNGHSAAGLFVVVGENGTILSSSNVVNWTGRSSGVSNMLRGLAWGSNTFVAVGNDGAIVSSSNGVDWVQRASGTNAGLQGVTYGLDTFVAVGVNGALLTSGNGQAWTSRDSGVAQWLLDVCCANSLFVAVGLSGRIITSPDGLVWTAQTSGTSEHLYRVAGGGDRYVAVGVNGTILSSTNGLQWSAETSGTTNFLRGIAYGQGAFMAAGYNGTVLMRGAMTQEEAVVVSAVAATNSQPSGALSDIIVYCSAGHGFTANSNNTAWITGRDLVNGVVEDMGNQDQLTAFAQYCFNAGATVAPMRPVGSQTNEAVIDNDDSGVEWIGSWNNSVATTNFFGDLGDVPYRYAYVDTNAETAIAVYRPVLPQAGFYPVYGWARRGNDRVRQLYRIRHSGGATEVRVNHRRVGMGWIWLGTYYFEAGSNGCVEISNYAPGGYNPVSDVVIADAIRFGNGMGDISRGSAGISPHAREWEASRYWIQNAVGSSMDTGIFDRVGLNDSDDNVGAPARMADSMDNEADGGPTNRLYLGFHSNAGSGSTRGSMGLYGTDNTAARQADQRIFGSNLVREIKSAMGWGDDRVYFNDGWADTDLDIYGDAYGEIRETSNPNMNATIIEVAYHDNVSDANLLKDMEARDMYARACYRGIVTYLHSTNPAVALSFLPDSPTHVCAVNSGPGVVRISWDPPSTNPVASQPATGYLVYRSTNGYGFGQPVSASGTMAVFSNLDLGGTYYFQVAATNAGGESLPSQTVGARVSPMGRAYHLVVNGFNRCDRSLSPTKYFANNIAGYVTLVRPRQINAFNYVVQHGSAIRSAGRYFDSCGNEVLLEGILKLTNYHAAYWILGEESTTNETFSSLEQAQVAAFLSFGQRLFVSGAELAWDLDHLGSAADKLFMTNLLRAGYSRDDAGTNRVTGKAGGILEGVGTGAFDDGSGPTYGVEYPDVLTPQAGAVAAQAYGSSSSGADTAAVQYSNQYKTVVCGYPFETLDTESARTGMMARVLAFFGDAEEEAPVVAITNAGAAVDYLVTQGGIGGTNNQAMWGNLVWTNTLTGESGMLAAAPGWQVAAITLAIGTNRLTIRGTNYLGTVSSDTVSIVRHSEDYDSDGDGIHDWWENLYFTNGVLAGPADDGDQDGMNNWKEWVSGTIPTNFSSYFKVEDSRTLSSGGKVIQWTSLSNRQYIVYWATNQMGNFSAFVSNVPPTPPLNLYTDIVHQGEALIFYQVGVEE